MSGFSIGRLRLDQYEDARLVALVAEIEFCSRSYLHAEQTKEFVWDEMVDFTILHFPMLVVSEIREAFRLAAAGTLDVELKTYYGSMTVTVLGDILSAYLDWRKRLFDALLQIRSRQEEQVIDKTVEIRLYRDSRLKYLLALENPTVEKVTAYDYDFLLQDGQLELTRDAKLVVYEQAKTALAAEYKNRVANTSSLGERTRLSRLLDAFQVGTDNEDLKAALKVYSQRLSVLYWLQWKKDPESPFAHLFTNNINYGKSN